VEVRDEVFFKSCAGRVRRRLLRFVSADAENKGVGAKKSLKVLRNCSFFIILR
jgi:hypothetical protein